MLSPKGTARRTPAAPPPPRGTPPPPRPRPAPRPRRRAPPPKCRPHYVLQGHIAVGRDAGELPQAGDRAVEHEAAMVDEGNSFGQAGDFGHVVGGEQHSPAAPAHLVAEELPDLLLDDNVHPDRGLVEEDDLRVVQQRR